MDKEFYSNCLFEAIKAKICNPKIRIMYYPAFLNEVRCPHFIWSDGKKEYDFHYKGRLPWYKWLWHKGHISTYHLGTYKRIMSMMIERKYYEGC